MCNSYTPEYSNLVRLKTRIGKTRMCCQKLHNIRRDGVNVICITLKHQVLQKRGETYSVLLLNIKLSGGRGQNAICFTLKHQEMLMLEILCVTVAIDCRGYWLVNIIDISRNCLLKAGWSGIGDRNCSHIF